MFLNENKEVTELRESLNTFLSKLKSMDEHLKALISKKLRLELEIKTLKKSMKEKIKHHKKDVRFKLSIESEEISQGSRAYVLLNEAGLLPTISEISRIEKEIREISGLFLNSNLEQKL